MRNENNAGFWIRAFAYLIDTLMIYTMFVLLGYGDYYYFVEINNTATAHVFQLENANLINAILNLANMVVIIFFWLYFNGQTPGKKLMGIKIISLDNGPITFKQAIIRYFGYFISAFMLGIGFIMIGVRKDKRGLHDLMANTKVIFDTK